MKIKDESGNIIAEIDLQDGFSVADLVKSLSTKKVRASLKNLKSIEESKDKKQIVFKFEDGSIFYDLPTKNFVRENGVKIGEGSFKNIKLNINNKVTKVGYHDHDNFWVVLSEKTSVPWIKTFFDIMDIWANKKYSGGGWMGVKERTYRNKIVRLIADKKNKSFIDCIESFAKISQIQLLEKENLTKLYDNLLTVTRDIARQNKSGNYHEDIINITLKKSKVDSWFFNRCHLPISENYIENETLINYMGDYVKCGDNNIKNLFQYAFEKYGGVIEYKQIDKIKALIKFGYEPNRLIDYLYRDIYNQGLALEFESDWVNALGALTVLYDYANMNEEMKREYDRYPRYLSTYHDITEKNYKIEENNIIKEKFNSRIKELKNMNLEYSNDEYSIMLPSNPEDLVKEGQELSHCVASYYKRMAAGETNIMFLRRKNNVTQSLVTIEIKNGEIIQAKGKNNSNPKESEMSFIKEYRNYLLKN